ncbi:MAG: BBE domain-containing protein [Gaiellaceae bacterium]
MALGWAIRRGSIIPCGQVVRTSVRYDPENFFRVDQNIPPSG